MENLDNEELNHQLYLLALALTDSAPNAAHQWGRDFLIRKGHQKGVTPLKKEKRSTKANKKLLERLNIFKGEVKKWKW